jgi:hypothetical protein
MFFPSLGCHENLWSFKKEPFAPSQCLNLPWRHGKKLLDSRKKIESNQYPTNIID